MTTIQKQLLKAQKATKLNDAAFCQMLHDNVENCKLTPRSWWRYMTNGASKRTPEPLQLYGILCAAKAFIDKKGGD